MQTFKNVMMKVLTVGFNFEKRKFEIEVIEFAKNGGNL